MKNSSQTLATLAIAAVISMPMLSRAGALPPGVIAKVNGVAITEAQLVRAVQQSGMPDTPTLRQALKAQLLSRELFRQEAAKNKAYDNRPEVKQAMQDAKDLAISQLYLRAAIKPAPVTEQQVKAQYDAIVASLGDNEYKARVILVKDDATAKSVLDQIKAGSDFARLAQQVSLAPNGKRGGELEWVSFKLPVQEGQTQNLPLPLAQAIVSLPDGGITAQPVVAGEQRFIVRLDQTRPTQIPKYDDVKAALRQSQEAQALEKATTALVVDLVKKARIEQ